MQILQLAAPILMGFLGKQKKNQGISNPNNVSGLLGGLLNQGTEQNLLEQVLDADGDGSMVNDVAGMLLGGSKKSGGLGGMLGRLLGGK